MPHSSPQYRHSGNPYGVENLTEDQVEPGPGQPLEPMPEHYYGVVFPYRGIQQHGVDPTDMPEDRPEDYAGGTVALADPIEPEHEPVPVRIVKSAKHEYNQWRAIQNYASPQGNKILNRKEGRTRCVIKNTSVAGIIYVGPDSMATLQTGYKLGPNETMELFGEQEVWAMSATVGVSEPLCAYFEFSTIEA